MTAVYAIAIVVGLVGIIAWVVFGVVGTSGAAPSSLDPEQRFGSRGRGVLGSVTGFGMAGISATYAGWNAVIAFAAAIVGGFVIGAVVMRLGPGADQ